jgi:hypothetical protein
MIQPIKVIVHDFPNFLSEYVQTKLFSLKASARLLNKIIIRDIRGFMGGYFAEVQAETNIKGKGSLKTAFISNSIGKMRLKEEGNLKLKLNANGVSKIKTAGTGTTPLMKHKAYLVPEKYYIGVTLKLSYWDDKELEDIDGITIGDMSITDIS